MKKSAETRNNRAKLLSKLFSIMKEIPTLEKTGAMPGEGEEIAYKYHEKGATLEPFREAIIRNGVMCLPTKVEPVRWGNTTSLGGTFNYSEQCITFTFFDVDTGESLDCQFVGHGGDSLDKDAPKAATQALKYFLVNSFFVRGIELDGDSAEEQEAGKEANKPHIYMEGVPDVAIESNGEPIEHPWIMIDGVRAFAANRKHKTAGVLRKLAKMQENPPRVKVRAFMGSLNGNKNTQAIIDKIEIIETEAAQE